jgi:hypothetical protein
MLIKPSNGRCGSGRTIFASTCASTLVTSKGHDCFRGVGYATVFCLGNTRRGRARRRRRASVAAPRGSRVRRDGGPGRGRKRRSLSLGLKAMVVASVGPSGPGPLMKASVRSIGSLSLSRLRWPGMAFFFNHQSLLEYYYARGLFAPLPLFTPAEYHDETHIPYYHYPQIPHDPYPSHGSSFSSLPSSSSPPHGHSQSTAPRARPTTPPPSPPPPTRPSPSYLEFSSTPSITSSEPTRKLLVLDLNGTLLLRSPRPPKSSRGKYQPHPAPRRVMRRPYLTALRAYLFAPQTRAWLDVMVWSSAQPHSVEDMVLHALGDDRERLIALWARDTLGLPEDHYRASFPSPFLPMIKTIHHPLSGIRDNNHMSSL